MCYIYFCIRVWYLIVVLYLLKEYKNIYKNGICRGIYIFYLLLLGSIIYGIYCFFEKVMV